MSHKKSPSLRIKRRKRKIKKK